MSLPLVPQCPTADRPGYRRPRGVLLGAHANVPENELARELSLKLSHVLQDCTGTGAQAEEQSLSELSTRCSSKHGSLSQTMPGGLPAIEVGSRGSATPSTLHSSLVSLPDSDSDSIRHSTATATATMSLPDTDLTRRFPKRSGYARLRQMSAAMAALCNSDELFQEHQNINVDRAVGAWQAVMLVPSRRQSHERQERVRCLAREVLRAKRGSQDELAWTTKLERAKRMCD
eukprot:TRINITY_DN22088_c0_g1_i1.p1 TRINITY_DN22088_c0_g1~~TRINITY_DN22088_c0_g1_i1.p1  ORF type:complete len:231 (+),score=25.79 TRINITY_DN22088_c0_g1_i1:64-756(+)